MVTIYQSPVLKATVNNNGKQMWNGFSSDQASFLCSIPNPRRTPAEDLKSPTYFNDFTARLLYKDSIINNHSKLQGLLKLRDVVYKTVRVKFNRNMTQSVEMTGVNRDEGTDNQKIYVHGSRVVKKPATSISISTVQINYG